MLPGQEAIYPFTRKCISMPELYTTLVGSFPLEPTPENHERALRDQVELGIDYPVLPQLRDFIDMYLEPLASQRVLEKTRLGYKLSGSPWEAEPEVPPEYPPLADLAREMGAPYRLAVTGPFTLASSIAVPGGRPGDMFSSILGDREAFNRFLGYVEALARKLAAELRPAMVCLDEPMLSVIVGSRRILFGLTAREIGETLDRVLAAFTGAKWRGVHVCSRLPTLLKEPLLGLRNADFLDHEHSDIPANRGYYTRQELLAAGKALGYGIVSSKKPRVETFEEAYRLAEDAATRYGEALRFLKPDCGFRGLAGARGGREYEEIVLPKLKTLVAVTERLGDRLG